MVKRILILALFLFLPTLMYGQSTNNWKMTDSTEGKESIYVSSSTSHLVFICLHNLPLRGFRMYVPAEPKLSPWTFFDKPSTIVGWKFPPSDSMIFSPATVGVFDSSGQRTYILDLITNPELTALIAITSRVTIIYQGTLRLFESTFDLGSNHYLEGMIPILKKCI